MTLPATSERQQLVALTAVFALTLGVVYAFGDPFLWVGWGIAMVVVNGAALVRMNR